MSVRYSSYLPPPLERVRGGKTVGNLVLGFSYMSLDLGSTMVADSTRSDAIY